VKKRARPTVAEPGRNATKRMTIIALTGPFGSGSTTCAEILKDRLGYTIIRLSDAIRKVWTAENPKKTPARSDLQALGNRIRGDSANPGELARLAIEGLRVRPALDRIVIDGVRNIGEIETLRDGFGRGFFLFALECPASDRFGRLRSVYGQDLTLFSEDNERDRDQEDAFGQQVELCVDAADVLLTNDDSVTQRILRDKVVESVRLVTGEVPRYPYPHEILMNLAYSSSHGSKCLKRQVGAVLVNAPPLAMGDVVGQGFNENPTGTAPCVEEPRYGAVPKESIPGRCFRDMVRHESYVSLAKRRARCPSCGERLKVPTVEVPPWHCGACGSNLDRFFWPERAMSLCTAVHAETAALMAAGERARGSTLYSTTFPCFQCAEKITHAGVKAVVYNEPYPDVRAAERLQISKVNVVRFEGIRSGRFDEIFSRARPYIARQRAVPKVSA
jgi:deoxycytidylate deaminase